jgi:hypothetical protein
VHFLNKNFEFSGSGVVDHYKKHTKWPFDVFQIKKSMPTALQTEADNCNQITHHPPE